MSKQRTWLFHQDHPNRIFDITPEEQAELEKEGWVDTPAKLKPKAVEVKAPDNSPATLSPEAERLLAVFVSNPASMSKDELIELGKAFSIEKLTRNMSEATLIKRIQDYLDGNSQ